MKLYPWLILALFGCNGNAKDRDVDVETVDDLPSPTQSLAVAGIDPAYGTAERVFPVELFGSGFMSGATVSFSDHPGSAAKVQGGKSITVTVPALPPGLYNVTVTNPDGGKSSLRRALTIKEPLDATGCRNFSVYFDTDSSVVPPAARGQLESLAGCAKSSGATVRVEGNCDDTGTTEYNLALGQRRAESVTRYLQGLGISPQKLRAVSYGEERPQGFGSDEAARSKNRRADITILE